LLYWAGHVIKRPAGALLSKIFKSVFVHGRKSHEWLKNSWKEAVDRDYNVLGIGNWQIVVSYK